MTVVGLRYHFRQRFRVGADVAFAWCTDFGPQDSTLFGDRRRRSTRWLSPDTALMTDTTWPKGRMLRITRLVRIFPEQRAWTNTHLTGPFRYSQYWYQIVPEGPRRSHLEFDGLRVETVGHPVGKAEELRRAEACRRSDSGIWSKFLAPALHRDLLQDPK